MPINLEQLVKNLEPKRTVLLFGSGSSVPSGAPTADDLVARFAGKFGLPTQGFSLSEIASLAEKKTSRGAVIKELRKLCGNLRPTGGLKNLPLYEWKSIFTTNYDDLIEQVYSARKKILRVYNSNFDFTTGGDDADCDLFKLHGTIAGEVIDGGNSPIILTEGDYDLTQEYRRFLYDRLRGDLAGANLVVIGHSLADPNIRDVVNRAAHLNEEAGSPARIWLLLYTPDDDRASLFEERGFIVCYGGIDEFFDALSPLLNADTSPKNETGNPLDSIPSLRPITVDVAHSKAQPTDISAMFNGRPARYSDVEVGYTFQRTVAENIADYFDSETTLCAILLGASGVGKTTAARQALLRMSDSGVTAWEHKDDHTLNVNAWAAVASQLKERGEFGVLFLDSGHHHLQELNDLADNLVRNENTHLKLLVVSTRNHWLPRNKTPNIYKYGQEFVLSQLSASEINRLLTLLDQSPEVRSLVEQQFSGFNKTERRRRLVVRCERDMFVCMKNIFANDSFDNIVLQEFAELDPPLRDIYRYVAALETAGVRIHRQLIIRLLGIPADGIQSVLENLTDIVREYTIDARLGVYGWRCRHLVISNIVTKYKYNDIKKTIQLFDDVIDNISPTFDIEIRSLRELCNIQTGLPRIPDKEVQNRLLRKMMSNAPGERVPRHRLIRNLIDQGHFEKAETEIRLFNSDFGSDGPVHRYRVKLMVQRAIRSPGLLEEDRIAILEQARELAVLGAEKYQMNRTMLSAYAELGIEYYKITGKYAYYDEAISLLEKAEEALGDPQITHAIRLYSRRMAAQTNVRPKSDETAE